MEMPTTGSCQDEGLPSPPSPMRIVFLHSEDYSFYNSQAFSFLEYEDGDENVHDLEEDVVEAAFEWVEFKNHQGEVLYYNSRTEKSVLEKPPALRAYESAIDKENQRLVECEVQVEHLSIQEERPERSDIPNSDTKKEPEENGNLKETKGFGDSCGTPRFRGGRGGFMGGPNMRVGPGDIGPGFIGGHLKRPFRPPGGSWNGPQGHNMGHGGGGGNGNEFMSPGGGNDSQDSVIWAETKTDTGSSYYYNTKTRSTSWDRRKGPGMKIMSHEEWSPRKASSGENPRFGENESPEITKPGYDQGPPQGHGNFAPRPTMGGPNPGNPMQGPPNQQSRTIRRLRKRPSTISTSAALGQSQNPLRPPGPVNPFSGPGENGFAGSQEDKDDGGRLHKPPAVPVGMPPQQGPPGVPPPTGVPPPIMNPVDPVLQHIDPQVVARAFEWTEQMSPDGKPYYFNAKTQASVWRKPLEVFQLQTAKAIAQQRVVQQAMINETKEKLTDTTLATSEPSKSKEAETRRSSGDKCRPVSSTPVTGTPWCVVWTGDKRVFFYNPSTKTSVWERPQDLIGRMDVEEMLRNIPSTKNIPPASVKKTEPTSTTDSANSTTTTANAEKDSHPPESIEAPTAKAADWAGKLDTKIVINLEKRGRDKGEISIGGGAPPEKKQKSEDNTSDDGTQCEIRSLGLTPPPLRMIPWNPPPMVFEVPKAYFWREAASDDPRVTCFHGRPSVGDCLPGPSAPECNFDAAKGSVWERVKKRARKVVRRFKKT